MKLKNKVVIVTGGSRGIGRAICLLFAQEGAKVVINYSQEADQGRFLNSAKKLQKEIKLLGGKSDIFEADVSSKLKVDEMFSWVIKKYGRVDILVSNAGICLFKEFLKIDEKLLDQTISVNLKGSFFCAQAAAKQMVKVKTKGRIVFISSVSSIFGGELQAHYCATKGAINQLMKSISIAVGKYGITSNAVLPGTVITDINRRELNDDKKLMDYFIKRTPTCRLATPKDIAQAALFFASNESAAVSGTTLIVDGGMSINLQ